ncbi:MAG: diadenylate cyclase CdaA [Phototrophicales bacterium]|nr:diadenylate cyclase CdaA [Phototrophicales bacterium]
MELLWTLESITFTDLIDIFIVALFFYSLAYFVRGTQAMALVRGTILVAVVMSLFSSIFQLRAVGWLLTNILTALAIALPVIFQPELRRFLERLGRGNFFGRSAPETIRQAIITEICEAAEKLSERRHGALIVLQRKSGLDEYIRTGISLRSQVSAEMLLTIFWPKTELHDGAAIIDNDGLLAAAACVLPLTASRNLPSKKMGTRHRAALGISEVSDALCVIVSEETGRISVTNGGRMVSQMSIDRLRNMLDTFYGAPITPAVSSLRAVERFRGLVQWLQEQRKAS